MRYVCTVFVHVCKYIHTYNVHVCVHTYTHTYDVHVCVRMCVRTCTTVPVNGGDGTSRV